MQVFLLTISLNFYIMLFNALIAHIVTQFIIEKRKLLQMIRFTMIDFLRAYFL